MSDIQHGILTAPQFNTADKYLESLKIEYANTPTGTDRARELETLIAERAKELDAQ